MQIKSLELIPKVEPTSSGKLFGGTPKMGSKNALGSGTPGFGWTPKQKQIHAGKKYKKCLITDRTDTTTENKHNWY